MSSTFTINIPERYWQPIQHAPKNRPVFIRDDFGHVDLGKIEKGLWVTELQSCPVPTQFANLNII